MDIILIRVQSTLASPMFSCLGFHFFGKMEAEDTGFPFCFRKVLPPTVQTRLVSVAEPGCIQMRCVGWLGWVTWGGDSTGADAGTEKVTWMAQVLLLLLLGPWPACIPVKKPRV